jgi:hypothetical protein
MTDAGREAYRRGKAAGVARTFPTNCLSVEPGLACITQPLSPATTSIEVPLRVSKATLVLWAAVLASTSACGTARRFGKDVTITVASPLVILYGAANDSIVSSGNVGEALGGGTVMEILTIPFTFAYHTIEHAIYCGIHAVDACLFPIYGCADLSPYGPDIQPLDFYQGTIFDKETTSTDPESGESTTQPAPTPNR